MDKNKLLEEYKNILNSMTLRYAKSTKQSGLFTSNHTKFDITISRHGKNINFTYQCNMRFNIPNIEDCISSLIIEDESDSMLKLIMNDNEISILKKLLRWH